MKTYHKKVLLMTSPRPPMGTSPLHYGDFRPPLGLGFLAGVLRNKGHEVLILDNYLQDNDLPAVINTFRPDFTGIYVHSASFPQALKLIIQVKQLNPAPVIVGGPHATLMPEDFPESVDFVVAGEGENAIVEIVEGMAKVRIIQGQRLSSAELERIPWPDYADFCDEPYNWKLDIFKLDLKRVFSMNTSRGCPYQCRFCGVARVSGRQYRYFSAARIVAEMESLKKKYDIDGIYFREDNFTALRSRLREFCNLIIEKKLDIAWTSESRADAVDEQELELMYKSGCRGLYVGVESGSQRVLDNMNKGISVERIIAFFQSCRKIGIKTYATFCFGTPTETEADRQKTEELIEKISPTYLDRFVYIGIPRSDFYDFILNNGLYYHKDESGFIYPQGYRELAGRYYGKQDQRFIA